MTCRLKRYWLLLRTFLIRSGYRRASFMRRKQIFSAQGEGCYFQIWNFGTEPHMISFGENVYLTSGVRIVTHDITAQMFRFMDHDPTYENRRGHLTIGSNVFVGANTTLLYDVAIGDNVIIGAGSVVNHDIPSGSVAAGVPCRVIGSFWDYKERITGNRKGETRGSSDAVLRNL